MVQLGIQKELLVGINVHLATLNSKVATQEARIGKIEMIGAFHDGEKKGSKTVIIAVWSVISALLTIGGVSLIQNLHL